MPSSVCVYIESHPTGPGIQGEPTATLKGSSSQWRRGAVNKYILVYTRTIMHIHAYIRANMPIYTCIRVLSCIYMRIYALTCLYTHVYTRWHAYIYIRIYTRAIMHITRTCYTPACMYICMPYTAHCVHSATVKGSRTHRLVIIRRLTLHCSTTHTLMQIDR
jgi:hypothetical protein